MTDFQTHTQAENAAENAAGDPNFPWPPVNRPPEQGHLKFFRTNYDLELADPSSSDTIRIIVGAVHKSTVYLPASAMQETSKRFTRLLGPDLIHASLRLIRLPQVDPALFDLYARWLFTGAEILIDEYDWKAEYAEYLRWQLDLKDDRYGIKFDPKKELCPVTVWDFERTTAAWFLGEYLESPAFQNHCMGHLYYMHRRFDHILSDEPGRDFVNNGHWGTIAYVRLGDVAYAWMHSEYEGGGSLLHPLRRFYVHWLERYRDAYVLSNSDYMAQTSIVDLIAKCPHLAYKCLCVYMSRSELEGRDWIMQKLDAYWVDMGNYSEDVQRRLGDTLTAHQSAVD